ncbi:uncharacterized protein Bfra_008282 [Botrytis fragariae]|uniref:RelA/SpoT domain-containing protein n=1 Tax=Botrytis fragariae TaxID=1964551 RepID=A0A8H6ATB7_9HELO|nr:uncharacterized protein Bfra_008282 [Botrytis fragariae]KAF5873005.1 hypothetical protein Bfra_008282 [Botrytis fragariae]
MARFESIYINYALIALIASVHHLETVRYLFDGKLDTMEAYTAKVIDVCNKALTSGNIRHPPITHRIKKWESAEGTLRRRQKERIARQRLRTVVQSKGWSWPDWCRILGQEQCEEEIGPFQNPQEILDALHDFSGLRISLYFPGDVERVVSLLSNRLQVISKWRKDQDSDIAQKLEKCIEVLNEPGAAGKAADLVKGEFPGYRATHLIVKLAPKDIPPTKISPWKDIKVEIQIGTLIMHVWSEIEHDMLYKPLASQDQKISREEEQVLNIINGIVMTGEGALRQLETCMERRQDQRTKDKSAFAISHHELGVWIEKYCAERAKPLVSHDWNRLPELFEILKATGDHKHSEVESIVEEVFQDQEKEARRDTISLFMLQVLCKRNLEAQPPSLELNGAGMLGPTAQFWAIHFVHSLNMATYLGVEEKFIGIPDRPEPSMTKMLDILHPYHPRCGDAADAQAIIYYCHGLLHRQHNPWVRVATLLSRTIGVIRTTDFGDSHDILVPGIMSRFFHLKSVSAINSSLGTGIMDVEQYWIIGFVRYYLDRESSRLSYDVWDQIKLLSTESRSPIDQQFFKPSNVPWHLFEYPDSRSWELIDPPILTLKRLGSGVSAIDSSKIQETSDSAEGILTLLYRLHCRKNWAQVKESYKLASSLGRPAIPDYSNSHPVTPQSHHAPGLGPLHHIPVGKLRYDIRYGGSLPPLAPPVKPLPAIPESTRADWPLGPEESNLSVPRTLVELPAAIPQEPILTHDSVTSPVDWMRHSSPHF